jgi:hypothetical protein
MVPYLKTANTQRLAMLEFPIYQSGNTFLLLQHPETPVLDEG